MSLWAEMEKRKNTYTTREMEIYNLVKKDPYSFSASTAMEIADKYNVSQSAISRFCKKVGYNGFSDFRLSMALETAIPSEVNSNYNGKDFIWYLTNYLQQVDNILNPELSDKIIEKILNAKCIYTTGYGASSFAASWLSFRLTLSRINSINIPSSQEMEYLHVMNSKDTMIIFSNSNPSHKDFFSLYMDLDNNDRPYIILISGTKNHPFAKYADIMCVLPNLHTLNYNYMIDSSIMQFDFAVLLINKILSCKSK